MEYRVEGTDLTAVANAIRTKGGTSAGLTFPDGFVSAVQNIPSGGSSVPVVVGTFTGGSAEAGSAKAITVPYTGNGYPIAGVFFPTSGAWETDSGIPELLSLNAVISWAFVKMDTSATPDYSSNTDDNKAESFFFYKSSATTASSTGAGRSHQNRMYNSGATAGAYNDSMVRIKSATSLSVYISDSGVGFIKDVPYTYMLIYSA